MWLNSNPHMIKITQKWPQSAQSNPKLTPKCHQTDLLVGYLPATCWFSLCVATHGTLKKPGKNVYFLFMGPSGPDTKRNDVHYTCHSTSTCHFWGPFFTFRPSSSVISTKVEPKVAPRWPNSCIKSLRSVGKMSVFWKTDPCDSKVILTWSKSPKSDPKVPKVTPN